MADFHHQVHRRHWEVSRDEAAISCPSPLRTEFRGLCGRAGEETQSGKQLTCRSTLVHLIFNWKGTAYRQNGHELLVLLSPPPTGMCTEPLEAPLLKMRIIMLNNPHPHIEVICSELTGNLTTGRKTTDLNPVALCPGAVVVIYCTCHRLVKKFNHAMSSKMSFESRQQWPSLRHSSSPREWDIHNKKARLDFFTHDGLTASTSMSKDKWDQ